MLNTDERGTVVQVEARPIELDADGWGTIPDSEADGRIHTRFFELSQQLDTGEYAREFYRDTGQSLVRTQVADFVAAFRAAGLAGVARKLARLRMKHVRRLFFKLR